jgi:anti-anti-sigma factor
MEDQMNLPPVVTTTTNLVMRLELATGQVVVAVNGEIDIATAPDLDAVLNAVIDRGYRRVALDLSQLAFLDAQGLRVLLRAHERLAPDGQLTLSSAPSSLRRLIEITGLSRTLHVVGRPHQSSRARSLDLLGSVVDGATAQGVVDAALGLLAETAVATLAPADAASVTLRRHGQLVTVAASSPAVTDIDRHQYFTKEGPCVEAATSGEQREAIDLAVETRWPTFALRCRQQRLSSTFSAPLVVEGEPLGALNLYSRTPRAFGAMDRRRASELAALASTALGRAAAAAQARDRLEETLESRETIARATGVLMARGRVDADEASSLMRRMAVREARNICDVAEEISSSESDREPGPSDQDA